MILETPYRKLYDGKDSVKNVSLAEAGVDGMSFTEFTYQLLQGYDFYIYTK